jgi:hypothetical protein
MLDGLAGPTGPEGARPVSHWRARPYHRRVRESSMTFNWPDGHIRSYNTTGGTRWEESS